MPFNEAFNVVPQAEGSKMEVNTNAFKDGNELGAEAANKLIEVQAKLDEMQRTMTVDLNTDELKVANLAIERELEASIPNTFKSEYEAATSWERAAEAISFNILSNVNMFVATRLRDVIKKVDAESWTGTVSKDEAADIIRDLDPNITEADVVAFQDRYSTPSLLEQGGRAVASSFQSHRKQIDDAMNMR